MGRMIGIDLGGSSACVAVLEAGRPKVVPGRVGSPLRSPNLEEACCVALRELKAAAEAYLDEEVQEAVVALPAHLGYAGKRTIAEAGRRAGLTIGRAVHRATSAALTYALDNAKGQFVAVCALESDLCEVSILELAEGMVRVRAMVADTSPPGLDLEPRIRELCRRCLDEAGMRSDQMDEVLFVGGRRDHPDLDDIVLRVFGKKMNRALGADEAVAMGAAVETGTIAGTVNLVLLDVIAHTIGIETKDGGCVSLIERNSPVPTRKSRRFSTAGDRRGVEVHVLEGESDRAAGNRSLARLELTDLPPTPREIEVTIEIDVNRIASVGAEDLATGRGHDMVLYSIGTDSGLAEGTSKTHGEASTLVVLPPRPEDAAPGSEPALTEAKAARQIDGLRSNVVRMLQALESKITPNERERILAAVERGRRARNDDDLEELKASLKELEMAALMIGQALLRP